MKQQIRNGVFETNSSSTHSISISNKIIILSQQEYSDYKDGKLKISPDGEKITEEKYQKEIERIKKFCEKDFGVRKKRDYKTLEEYIDWRIQLYNFSHDIRSFGVGSEQEVFHEEREINGEMIHVISICEGEDYETAS